MAVATETRTHTEKGISLARGPALILGTVLLICGLYLLYKEHFFPPFSHFPNGHVKTNKVFFGIFGANGWTGMLTAAAGGLLLFGAAQHLLAKTMSLIVAIALGAAAIIAAISGNVLGMAAANVWTEIAWGIAASILLLNTLLPRRRKTVVDERVPVAQREPVDAREPVVERQRVVERQPVEHQPLVESASPASDQRLVEPAPADEDGGDTGSSPAARRAT